MKYPEGRQAEVTYTEFDETKTVPMLVMEYDPEKGLVGYIATERVLVAEQIQSVEFEDDV